MIEGFDYFIIVSMLSLVSLSLVYMFSKLFPSSKLGAYFNTNFSHFLVSHIIIIFILISMTGFKAFTNSYFGVDAIQKLQMYINNVLSRAILPEITHLATFIFISKSLSDFSITFGPSVWGYSLKPLAGLAFNVDAFSTLFAGLQAFYATLSIQYLGLSLIDEFMPLLLIVGFIFYIFPETKTAGAFIISLSLGFYIVFPFVYTISFLAFEDYCKQIGDSFYGILASKSSITIFFDVKTELKFLLSLALQIFTIPISANPFSTLLSKFSSLVYTLGRGGVLTTSMYFYLQPFINTFAHISIVSLFIPSLAMIITVAFINAMTRFLLWTN